MPAKALKPCCVYGCGQLTRGRYCESHKDRRKKHQSLYKSKRWQMVRKGYLLDHPLCAHCEDQGKTTLATEVDHVRPHEGVPARFWNGPLQGLCHHCHSRKTVICDGGF